MKVVVVPRSTARAQSERSERARPERIFLVGFMAAGKTAVGKALAELLGYRFVDLDQEIEADAGLSVRDIFEHRGEEAFRELERRALRQTASDRGLVVATGGGTPIAEENRSLIRRLGRSVWLKADFDTILARLDERGLCQRPLFRDPAQARRLYRQRHPAYRAADLGIEISPRDTVGEVAARIASLI